MSRIAGVCAPQHSDAASQQSPRALVESMKPRLLRGARVAMNGGTYAVDGAAFVKWGWRGSHVGFQTPNWMVVVDGDVYNANDLWRSMGVDAPDASIDAALVANLIENFGFDAAVQRLNGDFAIAAFDRKAGALSLVRDRFGIKPLYYVSRRDLRAFASRPGALVGLPGVSREPRRRFVACFAASHYRTFDNEPDRSPFEDVLQVEAGHVVRLAADGSVEKRRYWTLVGEPDFTLSEGELAAQYRELLIDAVKIRHAGAKKPAFTLSGGMDSSSVLACAVRASGEKQPAISTVYDDATYDESTEIRSMLDASVSEWHQVRIGTPDLLPSIARSIAANDEPLATATWLSHWILCDAAMHKGFGSLFGGMGGDELNAGEYEYFFFFFADLAAAHNDARLAAETDAWVHHHDHPIWKKSPAVMREGLARLVDMKVPGRVRSDENRRLRYLDALELDYFDLELWQPTLDQPYTSYLKNRTYQDIFRETAPCCLRAADRHTTAHGLDVIWPFFDHRLAELMFRVPSTMKIQGGVTKHLLRESMRGILPEETRTRVKKTGWNAPAHVWFSGDGHAQLMDLVTSKEFRGRGIYDVERVWQIVDEHDEIVRSGRPVDNHMMFLWQLVNLELWLRDNDRGDLV